MGGGERRGGAVKGGEGRYIGEWEGERGGEGQWKEEKGGTLVSGRGREEGRGSGGRREVHR